jgi:hypothetical protein
MKKRLLISEEEKNRILGLHKSKLINEQGDYQMDKKDKEIEQVLNSPIVDTPIANPDEVVVDPKVKYSCVTEHPYISTQTPNNQATRYIWGNLFFTLDGKYFRGGNEGDKFNYFCEGKIIKTEKDGNIKPSMNQSVTPDGVKVVTDFDKKYNYKKDGDMYYFQLKSKPESWNEAKGEAKIAIGYQVFKDKSVCKFPAGDACPNYNGEKWNENPEKDKVDFDKTQIGFCSTKYCSVKYIQDTINAIIKDADRKGHEKLKGLKLLVKDGQFGSQTQNYLYKLLGKVSATTQEVESEWKTK